MEQNTVTINQLIAQILDEMRRIGYSETTIWRYYQPAMGQFRKYYGQTGQAAYSPEITDEYISLNKERYERGEVTYQSFKKTRYVGRRMNEFFLSGQFRYTSQKRGTSFMLSEGNERIVDQFLCSRSCGDKSRYDAGWTVRKYLQYMEKRGHASLSDVTHDEVREFILKTAASIKTSGLHNVLLYLKHFHIFLKDSGIPAPDCVELFSYKVYRGMPIQSYVTDEELERILGVIDTETETGKRNRAIILVGATTGLRAIDIIRMKLTDIDWRKGEIKLVQSKTGTTTHVPLMKETVEALKDYILNARPKGTGCGEVFLRVSAPKTEIQDTTCIGCMFRSYQEKAGIRRQPFDGKGFHGLRRRLAKKLLVSGSPLTTVSQILGHDDTDSARQYLSLNTDDLRECALDFSVIPLERGVPVMSYGFTSGFAKDLEDMIALKATFGFSEATYLDRAKDFDRHCSSGHPDADRVTEPIVISWLKAGMSKADGTVHRKAAFARAFGRYQRSTGKDAYVISEMFTAGKSIFVPYIFSDDELKGLFHEIDLYEKAGRELEAALLSTYFRLTYTCGLRPNEGRLLKRSEVDLGSGEVRIVNTKWHKSRSIVMSEDMRAVVRSYAAMRDASFPENGYFFPRPDGSPYTAAWMGGKFRKFFARSKKDEPSELLPPVRVYDLRHRFATANLSRWLDRGIDIHSRLPYLQAYMGHKELAATAYYIHLLPENLVRSSGIDWDSMNRLVPEVELWER